MSHTESVLGGIRITTVCRKVQPTLPARDLVPMLGPMHLHFLHDTPQIYDSPPSTLNRMWVWRYHKSTETVNIQRFCCSCDAYGDAHHPIVLKLRVRCTTDAYPGTSGGSLRVCRGRINTLGISIYGLECFVYTFGYLVWGSLGWHQY